MTTQQILLTGANGQLGQTFRELWPASSSAATHELLCCDIEELDITDRQAVFDFLPESVAAVVNCAGYTAVDAAETNREIAFAVNEQGPANLAEWCQSHQARMVHISTDFVFDGSKTTPYSPGDEPAPLGVYGASKLAGEHAVSRVLADAAVVLRTSWLYSSFMANFVKTMLRLMAEREELKVVSDQIGSPTSTFTLARVILSALGANSRSGLYHWSDGGEISWYDFAVAIQEEAIDAGLLDRAIPVHPITTDQFPTAAKRPVYSVLDVAKTQQDFDCPAQDWRQQLRYVIERLALSGQ